MAGLDISMPGLDLTADYGFPDYYGDLLLEAVNNGSVPYSRIDDMVSPGLTLRAFERFHEILIFAGFMILRRLASI